MGVVVWHSGCGDGRRYGIVGVVMGGGVAKWVW